MSVSSEVEKAVSPAPVFRPNAKYVLLLGMMCALPAISNDIYLPSLPDVAQDLHTSATAAQLTMTAMMLGGAVGQLVIGPLSDRFGRRKPVLVGVALHVLTSALCAIVPTIGVLIGLR
ncbi:MAG TPA: MFS transporter, partial [Cellulomonas sp.]|nr:MFS transporter [Cellulomonas sp.]